MGYGSCLFDSFRGALPLVLASTPVPRRIGLNLSNLWTAGSGLRFSVVGSAGSPLRSALRPLRETLLYRLAGHGGPAHKPRNPRSPFSLPGVSISLCER